MAPYCQAWTVIFLFSLSTGPLLASGKPLKHHHEKHNSGAHHQHCLSLDDIEHFREELTSSVENATAEIKQWTRLHLASFYGNDTAVAHLLSNDKIPINARNSATGETPLHLAAFGGHVEVVQSLIRAVWKNEGYSVTDVVETEQKEAKWTPLFYAAVSKAPSEHVVQVVKELVENGTANLENRDSHGMQSIHIAMISGRLDVVRTLLSINPKMAQSKCTDSGKTISHLAAENNMIEFLDQMPQFFDALEPDDEGESAACLAAIKGSVEFGRKMAELGNAIDSTNCVIQCHDKKPTNGTALHAAVIHRHTDYVDLLIQQMVAPKQKQENSSSCDPVPIIENASINISSLPPPLSFGAKVEFNCSNGYVLRGSNVIECNENGKWVIRGYCDGFCSHSNIIVENGRLFKIGSQQNVTCQVGFKKVGTSELATCGPDGNWQSKSRCIPDIKKLEAMQHNLEEAVAEGDTETVRSLLQHGVLDVNWRLDECRVNNCTDLPLTNSTVLHLALACNRTEIARLLLEEGAEVDHEIVGGTLSPLAVAAASGNMDTVRLLLDRGAEVACEHDDSFSPLLMAAQRGHAEVVHLLIEKGADVNGTDSAGRTALMVASEQGHVETARLLIEKGAAVGSVANDGETAVMKAVKMNKKKVVTLLKENGASTNVSLKKEAVDEGTSEEQNVTVAAAQKDEGHDSFEIKAGENDEESATKKADDSSEETKPEKGDGVSSPQPPKHDKRTDDKKKKNKSDAVAKLVSSTEATAEDKEGKEEGKVSSKANKNESSSEDSSSNSSNKDSKNKEKSDD